VTLYIHDNELVKGMIDKAQFGKFGIVHTVHELYGADAAGDLLSVFSRLFTMFLQVTFVLMFHFFTSEKFLIYPSDQTSCSPENTWANLKAVSTEH
jgi:RNA polymerase Rpb1, domain 3